MIRRLIQPNLIRRSMATPIGGGVYVSAGRLGGVGGVIRATDGESHSATEVWIAFSGCVRIEGLTGVRVTVNGTPQTPLASVKIADRTWAFLIAPMAHGDTLVWSYDGTGGITDCRTGKDIGEQTITLSTVAEPVPDDGGSGWVRPADWPVLWSPAPGTEASVGLFAVNNTADERVAMTMSGDYTVDWGDGIVENFAAGVRAEHNYVYANLTSPVTSAGYKTAIIRVTPQAGNSLMRVDIATPHTGAVPASTKWLDIELRCPNATAFVTGTGTALKPLVQRILVRGHNTQNMAQNFRGCAALRSVPLFDTQNVTTMASMFNGAAALTTVPLFDTQNVLNMQGMFNGAAALTTVPLFDTQNVTTMASMFNGAAALTTVPLFDTQNVTTMASMFNGCASLTTVPLFDTRNVTTIQNFVSLCSSLLSLPLFNLASNINMQSMFRDCPLLTSVPLWDTSKVTSMGFMSQNNIALIEMPAFDMRAVTAPAVNFMSNNVACTNMLAFGMRFSFDVLGALNATALNTVFTNLGMASGTQTINITGNPGAATANRTIATAKGWTVTG